MAKKQNSSKKGLFATLGNWCKRVFFGSKHIEQELQGASAAKAADVEAIVSPGRQIVNSFMERKLAVGALIVLLLMFVTMFVGPLFMPTYADTYTEVTQINLPPTMDMMSVPKELKNDIKMISGYGSFTVGLSNSGKVYVWGATGIGTTGVDVADIPKEVRKAKIAMVAAGFDHIVAIGEDGKIYAWGNDRHGQYLSQAQREAMGKDVNVNHIYITEELVQNGVDVKNVKKLVCGYQATAILMNDGTLHIWGNKHAYSNLESFAFGTKMHDIDFTLNYVVGVDQRRTSVFTGTRGLYHKLRDNVGQPSVDTKDYLQGRKIESIDAASTNLCVTLDDGSICFSGDFTSKDIAYPALAEGEVFTQVEAGIHHYSGLTNKGNVYSWGRTTLGQTKVPKAAAGAEVLYAGGFQTYAVDGKGALEAKWGLKGYLFGTDNRGADIFQRIINGGKMTMTIGAVAVIISSIIGIVIGCIAGYFGGKVDILLMRIAEVFSAIPFLPFAMILSAVMGSMDLTENQRIFIIMCILGVLSWTGLARLVRGQVLVVRESEYVTAAKSMGVKEGIIAFKHILPNVMSVILVNLMLNFGTCMLTESSLSYLGFGVAYPRPTWGNMLNGANNETIINSFWWQWVFTAIFLAVTTICINIVGDALRDVMDPKSSSER